MVKEDEIRHKWQEYFDKLFNDENKNTTVQRTTRLMTLIGALCGGFKIEGQRSLENDERGQSDGT